jgi:hypothetical protein
LKHRLQIARRAGDNLEYLRGRRLLLQRLFQLASGLIELPSQISIRRTATDEPLAELMLVTFVISR